MQLNLFADPPSLQSRMEEAMKRIIAKQEQSPEFRRTISMIRSPGGLLILKISSRARKTIAHNWPTPNVPNGERQASEESMSSTGQTPDGRKRQVDLNFVVQLAGWPTCTADNATNGNSLESWKKRAATNENIRRPAERLNSCCPGDL